MATRARCKTLTEPRRNSFFRHISDLHNWSCSSKVVFADAKTDQEPARMQDHRELLNLPRPFCDPATGEVVQRLPDKLMLQLCAANLARGIPGCQSNHTQTGGTWFVFFTDEIRDQVLLGFREANYNRKRGRKAVVSSTEQHPTGND